MGTAFLYFRLCERTSLDCVLLKGEGFETRQFALPPLYPCCFNSDAPAVSGAGNNRHSRSVEGISRVPPPALIPPSVPILSPFECQMKSAQWRRGDLELYQRLCRTGADLQLSAYGEDLLGQSALGVLILSTPDFA